MGNSLVIVESPTKARTIRRFLDNDANVQACMGHIRDLPQRSLGVDLRQDFKPRYVVNSSGRKVLKTLQNAAAKAADIYLATDPDREGEAIAWHLAEVLKKHTSARFHRVAFHEITSAAIKEAFAHPGHIDTQKVDAQQARRILDRIVGYKISPLLWRHIKKGTSAGRVQSVALRLVCERERAIQDFEPTEYWNLTATFNSEPVTTSFDARLFKLDNKNPHVQDQKTAETLADELDTASFTIHKQTKKRKKRRAAPPFITSTLQQSAGSSLRFTTRRTMQIAQQLYEGVELGDQGATGLITYMRTDSVQVAKEARDAAAAFIKSTYGADYVPHRPNVYRSRQSAQAAHEAIRPTDVHRTPESMAHTLSPEQLRLYRLIWNRFVASQMAPALEDEVTIDVAAHGERLTHAYLFRATSTKTVFPGFRRVYQEHELDDEKMNPSSTELPELKEGTPCALAKLHKEQKFTQPPKRYTEATLVRELEQNGVGRPSTYASIINTIQQRDYVKKQKGNLMPTPLGFSVADYLVNTMPDLFQVNFTAEMESQLDKIEGGDVDSTTMLSHFYENFRKWGSEVELLAVPDTDTISRFLDLFHEDIRWSEPVQRGRQTFDDHKFFKSLRRQLQEKQTFSDKQWRALLALAARYAGQLSRLRELSRDVGIEQEMDSLIASQTSDGDGPGTKAEAPKPSQETLDYIKALQSVDQWEPPRKNGKRTYDDRKFFDSLREQVEGGRALSTAQQRALQRLLQKYNQQVDTFDTLNERYGVQRPPPKKQVEESTVQPLVNLLQHVSDWAKPRKTRRGRTYDDKEFARSITKQFEEKRNLSERQVAALRKLLLKYHDQIPDYDTHADRLGLPTPAENTPSSDLGATTEPCPECGKPLALRRGKRGAFYGCSGYPKCRFTKPASEHHSSESDSPQ